MLKKTTKGKKAEAVGSGNKTEQLIESAQAEAAAHAPHAEQPSKGLPLFFSKPQALDKNRHANAGVRPIQDYRFAATTNSIPLNAIEFIEAAKFFPIVFTADEQPTPAAIVGLEQQNYFVEENGSWKKQSYVPAYVRQYPFVFFERKEEEKFYLCIDEASAAYQEKIGEGMIPLFKEGEPTAATQNALQFCTAFYNHHQITRNFCADLKKHDLLVPYHSQAQLASGKQINLGGFLMIDEQRFNALSDEVFLEFRKKGWLAFIYLALASTANWKTLVDLASSANPAKAA